MKDPIALIEEKVASKNTMEINLDDTVIERIDERLAQKLESVCGLTILTLNDCNLCTLKNFPKLPELLRLELINNKFEADDLRHLLQLKKLQSLSLNNCKIRDINDLRVLTEFEELVQLDVNYTDITKQTNFTKEIFELLPNLQILNNKDDKGNDIEYSSESNEIEESETDSKEDYSDEDYDDDSEEYYQSEENDQAMDNGRLKRHKVD